MQQTNFEFGREYWTKFNKSPFQKRLHSLYGALRLLSFIADLFVIYHSKGLKLTDSENEKLEEDKEENKKQKENGVGEQLEQQKEFEENDLERYRE